MTGSGMSTLAGQAAGVTGRWRAWLIGVVLIAGLGGQAGRVDALDLGPLSGIAPPAGVTGLSLELSERSLSGRLDVGAGMSVDATVDRRSANLRLGQAFSLGDRPAYVYGELPFVDYDLSGEAASQFDLDGGHGVGDAALALAVWPLADRVAGRFLGVAGYLIAPTGEYKVDRTLGANLNPGSNRYAGILQAGFHQRLPAGFEWSLAADVMAFGDNDDYIGDRVTMGPEGLVPARPATLEVKPYHSYQTSLAWRGHPAVTLAASYYIDRGAASRVDGGDWGPSINRDRYGLWGLFALTRQTRLNVSLKRAVSDRSALSLDSAVQVRLVQFF
ncbi:transporter [Spiribacter sp. 1M153]|uniref:transporter n=1 Tax=Spiribacter roseus TaxID=1855875 RepID=UPI00349F4F2F